MKNINFKISFMAGLCFLLLAAPVSAQTPSSSSWYWVVESNIHVKKNYLVKFYNTQHQVVYEEQVTGRTLNIKRPRHKRLLNNALQQVMVAPPTLAILGNKKLQKQMAAATTK